MAIAFLELAAREPLIKWNSPWTILLFGVFFLMVIMGTWTGAVAAGRGRSMQWWFIIGFLLPIIGLIVVYILKPLPADQKKE